MPTAKNPSQNASPLQSQCSTAQKSTTANRTGLRSTLKPCAKWVSAFRPGSSSFGATFRANASYAPMSQAGKYTMLYKITARTASRIVPTIATRVVETSPTLAPVGNDGNSIAITVSISTTNASNNRSTARDASAAEKGTFGSSRVSAYPRANSPTRAGTTLFTIMPIAVARQSDQYGSRGATGSRIGRHRIARSGTQIVAVIDAAANSSRFEVRSTAQTCDSGIWCRTHASS